NGIDGQVEFAGGASEREARGIDCTNAKSEHGLGNGASGRLVHPPPCPALQPARTHLSGVQLPRALDATTPGTIGSTVSLTVQCSATDKATLPIFETAVFVEITDENRRNARFRSTGAESQPIGAIKSRSTWHGVLKVVEKPSWYAGC